MKPFKCKKIDHRWQIQVAPGAVATIGFVAGFKTFDKACEYMRYWLPRLRTQ